MQNFQRLTTGLPVAALNAAIGRQPELWAEITDRQSYDGSAHRATETIFLRWCKGQTLEAAFTEIPAIDYPATVKLPGAYSLIQEAMKKIGSTELGRVLIVSLKPKGMITAHVDEGAYADHYERFHLVLEAEVGNCFFCDDEMVEMKPGELWNFDHKKSHWVWNDSDNPRVHLIIDAVAPDFRRERNALSA